jgi:regulator of cell morphogenesis and NO signaling
MANQPPSTRIVQAKLLALPKLLALHSPIPDRLSTFTARRLEHNRVGFTFSLRDKRADFFAEYPELDAACERIGFGWDFTLGSWCTNPTWALEELARSASPRPPAVQEDWTSAGIDELVDHLVKHHHQPLRWELTRLGYLINRLATLHQQRELQELATGFSLLRDCLLVHLLQEEVDAFPLCVQLDQSSHHPGEMINDSARDQLHVMAAGHFEIIDDVERLQVLAERAIAISDPDIPIITAGLTAMREDLVVHTRTENDILLPAAMFAADLILSRRH